MKLPDFMKYKDKFSFKGFFDKIQGVAKRAGSKMTYGALILFYALDSDKMSAKDKALIIGALGYLIFPADVFPDALPLVGLSDDLSVLFYVVGKVWSAISEDVKEKARAKMANWFDEDEVMRADRHFLKVSTRFPV